MSKTADRRLLPQKICWRHHEGENLPWEARKDVTNGFGAFDDEGPLLGSYSFIL